MKRLLLGIAALAVLSACAADPVTETRTVTEAITETVTASPEVVVETKTVTTFRTPPACIKVLNIVADALDVLSEWPPLVGEAYEAGLNMDMSQAQGVLTDMKRLNSQITRLTPAATAAAQACRAQA